MAKTIEERIDILKKRIATAEVARDKKLTAFKDSEANVKKLKKELDDNIKEQKQEKANKILEIAEKEGLSIEDILNKIKA